MSKRHWIERSEKGDRGAGPDNLVAVRPCSHVELPYVVVNGTQKGPTLVVIAGTMAQFNLPEAGLVLILAVDQFLDMGRTGTNVVGNAVATAVVARWEGQLDKPDPTPIDRAHAPSSRLGTAHPAPREGEPGGVS